MLLNNKVRENEFINYIGVQNYKYHNLPSIKKTNIQSDFEIPSSIVGIKEITRVYVETSVIKTSIVPGMNKVSYEGIVIDHYIYAICGKIELKVEYIQNDEQNRLGVIPISKHFTTYISQPDCENLTQIEIGVEDCSVKYIGEKNLFYFACLRIMGS